MRTEGVVLGGSKAVNHHNAQQQGDTGWWFIGSGVRSIGQDRNRNKNRKYETSYNI
jgi:hypothetical protein